MEAKQSEMPSFTGTTGEHVLINPLAIGEEKAIAKANCKKTYQTNIGRILEFKNIIQKKNTSIIKEVIVIINANNTNGECIAEALLPGFNKQEIRDIGETSFARGITMKEVMYSYLRIFDTEAARKLSTINGGEIPVVVIDYEVAEVFKVQTIE